MNSEPARVDPTPAVALPESVDVLIVGGGLSGIGMACHLNKHCPEQRYLILEAREAIGGTWDLFRYPGIRSDSDMHTLGYSFKPWREAKAIADGPAIRRYVNETADEHGVREHVRFGWRVSSANWNTDSAEWLVTVNHGDLGERQIRCNFLSMCCGYYRYEAGHQPDFPGLDEYQGQVIHPQHWPEGLDTSGKRVVVIGSGATAVTLVPALVEEGAEKVTMLQRSPTYVVSRPARDSIANALRRILPEKWAYAITRWKNVTLQGFMYRRTRRVPEKVKALLLKGVRKQLGPDYDVERHFTPRYNPWDQRLCLVPDGDLFRVLRSGQADVVTEQIDRITADGVRLANGDTLPADILVTATGLELEVLGGIALQVDGAPVDLADTVTYQGMMFSGVPNLVQTFGYINASWTLRADLVAEYSCRLLNHMRKLGVRQCTPVTPADLQADRPWIDDFSAGYMQRSMHRFPRQAADSPWRNTQNYALDKKLLLEAPLEDGALHFGPLPVAIDQSRQVSAG